MNKRQKEFINEQKRCVFFYSYIYMEKDSRSQDEHETDPEELSEALRVMRLSSLSGSNPISVPDEAAINSMSDEDIQGVLMSLSFKDFIRVGKTNHNLRRIVSDILGNPHLLEMKLNNIEERELLGIRSKLISMEEPSPTEQSLLKMVKEIIGQKGITELKVKWEEWKQEHGGDCEDLSMIIDGVERPFDLNFIGEINKYDRFDYTVSNTVAATTQWSYTFTYDVTRIETNETSFKVKMDGWSRLGRGAFELGDRRHITFSYRTEDDTEIELFGERFGWSVDHNLGSYLRKFEDTGHRGKFQRAWDQASAKKKEKAMTKKEKARTKKEKARTKKAKKKKAKKKKKQTKKKTQQI